MTWERGILIVTGQHMQASCTHLHACAVEAFDSQWCAMLTNETATQQM